MKGKVPHGLTYLNDIGGLIKAPNVIKVGGAMRDFNERDPVEAPSCPYPIQPDNQGKLIWLSGPPGAGKSTTAQLMGKEAGYVYFEADCTMNACNPFVPTDVENPTLAAFQQKPLKVSNFHFRSLLGIMIWFHKISWK